jgi:soluble lytic murein transglycosylase-like protein
MPRDSDKFWLLAAGGALLLASLGGGAVVAVQAWKQSANAQKWLPFLDQAGAEFGLPQDLLGAMAQQESSFRQDVIDGTTPSKAGALGLMQMEPKYFTTVRRPVPFTDQDTQDQIAEAAAHLSDLYAQLFPLASSTGQNPWALVLAGYDAGAQAVKNAAGIPPYAETQKYVAKILGNAPAAAVA